MYVPTLHAGRGYSKGNCSARVAGHRDARLDLERMLPLPALTERASQAAHGQGRTYLLTRIHRILNFFYVATLTRIISYLKFIMYMRFRSIFAREYLYEYLFVCVLRP